MVSLWIRNEIQGNEQFDWHNNYIIVIILSKAGANMNKIHEKNEDV